GWSQYPQASAQAQAREQVASRTRGSRAAGARRSSTTAAKTAAACARGLTVAVLSGGNQSTGSARSDLAGVTSGYQGWRVSAAPGGAADGGAPARPARRRGPDRR